MYKLSMYNYYYEKEDTLYIVNTLSGAFVCIPRCNKARLINHVNGGNAAIGLLVQQGLVIDDSINERDIADLRFYEHVNENNLYLVIMPTFNCNFECKYCFEKHNELILDENTETGIRNFIRVRSKKVRKLYVSWFGGEPLTESNAVIRLMTYFQALSKEYGFHLIQNIVTNGYYLTPGIVEKLIQLNCIHYQITLDGPKHIHDFYRPLKDGTGTYETITENLRYIRDVIPNRRINVLLRINVTKRLEKELQQFADYLEKEFLTDRRFSVMWRKASDWDGSIVDEVKHDLHERKEWEELVSNLGNTSITWRGHSKVFKPYGCLCNCAYKNFFAIGPDGKVFRCLSEMYSNSKSVIGQIEKSGNLKLIQPADQWRIKPMYQKCNQCVFYPTCYAMNCPAQNILNFKRECPIDKGISETIITDLTKDANLWKIIEL